MLGAAESEMVRLISGEIIFLQNSNLYHHDTSTSQTDGLTDGQTTCLGNTALRVASRGKNWKTVGYPCICRHLGSLYQCFLQC